MAVPVVGLVACTAVSVGAAAGEVVNVAGAETGLVAPLGLVATTCDMLRRYGHRLSLHNGGRNSTSCIQQITQIRSAAAAA